MLQGQTSFRKCYYLAYLFMVGVFLGILAVNIGHDIWITEEGLLNVNMLERIGNSMSAGGSLLGYIIKSRLTTVIVIVLISTTMAGIPAVCAYICYIGITAGCLLSVAVIRYGIKGILLVAACVIPQGILLIPAYMLLFCLSVEGNRQLYGGGQESCYRPGHGHGARMWFQRGLRLFVIIIVVIIGCVVESYVNPKILNFIINIF